MEKTVAIIKPHAIQFRFPIFRRILSSNLLILQAGFNFLSVSFISLIRVNNFSQEKCIKLSIEQTQNFFKCHGDDNFQSEIREWSSGPLIALCLSHENAIEVWNDLMGPDSCIAARQKAPTSLRALYGDPANASLNAVYGSASVSDAQRDLKFFFPNSKMSFSCSQTMSFSQFFFFPFHIHLPRKYVYIHTTQQFLIHFMTSLKSIRSMFKTLFFAHSSMLFMKC
jgi:nucleoside diphosphate kinase